MLHEALIHGRAAQAFGALQAAHDALQQGYLATKTELMDCRLALKQAKHEVSTLEMALIHGGLPLPVPQDARCDRSVYRRDAALSGRGGPGDGRGPARASPARRAAR